MLKLYSMDLFNTSCLRQILNFLVTFMADHGASAVMAEALRMVRNLFQSAFCLKRLGTLGRNFRWKGHRHPNTVGVRKLDFSNDIKSSLFPFVTMHTFDSQSEDWQNSYPILSSFNHYSNVLQSCSLRIFINKYMS